MRRFTLSVAACLLACLPAAAQSGRTPDLRPLSVTQLITVEEYDGRKVVKTRDFTYELYFRDDGSVATVQPIISAFKLKRAFVRHFDRAVTADPRAALGGSAEGDEPGMVPFSAFVVTDPATGLPDHKVGGAVVKDKNGRETVLRRAHL